MARRPAHLALPAVSSNWSTIDPVRCTDSPQRAPQIGRLALAGADHVACVSQRCGRNEGWGSRACVFSSCYVHVSPDPFSSRFLPFLFLVLPAVPCRPVLLVPMMHDGDRRLILCLSSLAGFTLHTVCQ